MRPQGVYHFSPHCNLTRQWKFARKKSMRRITAAPRLARRDRIVPNLLGDVSLMPRIEGMKWLAKTKRRETIQCLRINCIGGCPGFGVKIEI
jgi:hypothetical protein